MDRKSIKSLAAGHQRAPRNNQVYHFTGESRYSSSVVDPNYNRFNIRERFTNNRIKGSIDNQFQQIMSANQKGKPLATGLGLQAPAIRAQMNQTLGQTYADSASSYNFNAHSLNATIANPGSSSKTPLSLLMKQDDIREKRRKKQAAVENHKKSAELQYQSFIKRRNAEYA